MKYFDKTSFFYTIVYTFGHFIIAIGCSYYILEAEINLAAIDAIVEPSINAFWFYLLHQVIKK